MANNKSYKRKKSANGAIAVMVTLILLMILSTVILFLPEKDTNKKSSKPAATAAPTMQVTPVPAEEEILAVVLETDTEIKMITVYDVEAEEQKKLVYTGATAFFDGYGIQMVPAQLEKGDMYRFLIDREEEWITNAYEAIDRREKPENTGVWEKTGVEYMTISDSKISFRGVNYRYSDRLCVMSNGRQISLTDIMPTVDIVTVRGVGQVIYEIVVTRGHGYISLKNHEDFIGGVITIGSTRIDSVYEDATYLVREGTYEVSVERGKYAGTEVVSVARDATAFFDVFLYGSGPVKKGWLSIKTDPAGADLYIDGVKTAYTDGVELEYGTYHFEFSEGGYIPYSATVWIDQPKQSLSVYLTEQKTENGNSGDDEDTTTDPNLSGEEENENTGDAAPEVVTSISVADMGYQLNLNNAIYILGPKDANIYLDGSYLGVAPIDFEKIIGTYVITVIRSDGSAKNFNCNENNDGTDSYYNFDWID